jgi:prepilin peptidase CpaA
MKVVEIILSIVLITCLITDLKRRKIFNFVTLPMILFGLIYHTYEGGFDGLLFSFKGLLVGVGLLLIPFILRGIGAGDVKLLGTIGALKGSFFVFYAFLYTALIGGVIALFILLYKKKLKGSLKRFGFAFIMARGNTGSKNLIDRSDLAPSFPYGVAIVLGTFSVQFLGAI